jgi:hypothetical protein
MSYLVIDLRVKKASMIQHYKLAAPTPVFAAVMFTHALDKKAGLGGVNGVGLVHRTYRPWIEQIPTTGGYLNDCLVVQRGSCGFVADGNKPREMSIQPAIYADLEWTLIVSCNRDVSDQGSVSRIRTTIKDMRFAGGMIERIRVSVFENWDEALRPRGGMWIDDVSHIVSSQYPEPHRPIHEFFEALAKKQGNKRQVWLAPANLGYAAIETPKQRSGSRSELPHLYAEHLLGLVSYTSAYTTPMEEKHLWKYGWVGSQFVVTNRPEQCLSKTAIFN